MQICPHSIREQLARIGDLQTMARMNNDAVGRESPRMRDGRRCGGPNIGNSRFSSQRKGKNKGNRKPKP